MLCNSDNHKSKSDITDAVHILFPAFITIITQVLSGLHVPCVFFIVLSTMICSQTCFCLRFQVLSGGRVLSLSSAQVSDTGRYTCVAVNAGGEQQREYDLRVYGEKITILLFLDRNRR